MKTKTPYRILIENDGIVNTSPYGQYGLFAERYGDPNQIFNVVIVDSITQETKIWEEINKADQIWLFTCFVGSSGRLMEKILSKAMEAGIKNKVVVNIDKWKDVCWFISDELRTMMKEATKNNNIQFIYADDKEYIELAKSL